MRTTLLLLIALCTLTAELASAQDRPYVAIFKSPSSGFTAGVKYPGSKELGAAVMVHEDGTVVENGRTLYKFRSYDDDSLVFYTPIPPGGGNNMKKPDGAAEAIGNGIVYLLTANAPVTKIERGGSDVSTAEYVRLAGGERAAAAPAQPGEGPITVSVAVYTFKKKKEEVQSKDDCLSFAVTDFEANGKLKQDVYLKIRDKLMVVEVNNHHEIQSFFFIRGGSRDREAIFYRWPFRGTSVFAELDPNDRLLPSPVLALTARNLTAEQLDFVRANWVKRLWIKANQLAGRTPAPPAANRTAEGETSLLGVR
jgi:hypothetical protein